MKGILFKPGLIPAIVEGRKTQTRRAIKPQPDLGLPEFDRYSHIAVDWYHPTKIDRMGKEYPGEQVFGAFTDDGEWGWRCPYLVGETVYIKEAHYRYGYWNETGKYTKAGRLEHQFIPTMDEVRYEENRPERVNAPSWQSNGWYRRSPLYLPESAARHFLKILAVRAERLQEITPGDVLKEGIPFAGEGSEIDALWDFMELWNSTNPKYPFDSNPWVWVYGFEFAGTQPREAT